jgi:hypothetical protein
MAMWASGILDNKVSIWFEFSNLPHPDMGGKHHGQSIMIDRPFA